MPKDLVAPFQKSCAAHARWQLANSVLPYVLLWVAMVYALAISYWLMLPIAVAAAGFLARIFIIFHCGHSSFFKSRRANNATGAIMQAALQGSSFYKLPRVLQWFTGNIGYHHIRHLNPRVPNYFLQQCHEAQPRFLEVRPITLLTSLRALTYRLWDERRKMFVGFGRSTCA